MKLDSKTLTGLIFTFFVILVFAMLFLFLAAAHIPSYAWGGSLPGGGVWDAWGVRVYPEFFIYYPLALLFFITTMIFHPLLISLLAKNKSTISSSKMNFAIGLGLFIPAEFVFGNPPVLTYEAVNLGPTIYELIAPLYQFTISWSVGIHPSVTLIGLLFLSMIGCLYLYREEKIDYRMFLMPIILVLLFSLLSVVQYFHGLITSTLSFPTLQLIVPSFALGILSLGQEIRKDEQSSTYAE